MLGETTGWETRGLETTESRATDFGSGDVHAEPPILYLGSHMLGDYRGWEAEPPILDLGSQMRESRATDFGSADVHAETPILDLGSHMLGH